MLKERATKLLISVAEKAAKESVCNASPWVRYQPIETERVRTWAFKEK